MPVMGYTQPSYFICALGWCIIELMSKHIDFHLALALVAVITVSGLVFLQFVQADTEFQTLNGLSYFTVRGQDTIDNSESAVLNRELDKLENELEALDVQEAAVN